MTAAALEDRVAQVRKHLATLGYAAATRRSAMVLVGACARGRRARGRDISFRIQFVNAARTCARSRRRSASTDHLPTPGPVIADRILTALFGATDTRA